jgi:transposase
VAGWKKKLNKNDTILAVYLDLKRASERIDRKILLEELYKNGIRDIQLQWFKSYLEDRYQRTLFNESCSEEAEINLGEAQGSAIGHLIFI